MSQPVYKNNTSVIPKESNLEQEQIGMFNVFVIQYCIVDIFFRSTDLIGEYTEKNLLHSYNEFIIECLC